jgi:Lon protease-like protein
MPGTEVTLNPKTASERAFLRHAFSERLSIGVVWRPKAGTLSQVGTIGFITEITECHDGTCSVKVQGARRFTLLELVKGAPTWLARIEYHDDLKDATARDPIVRQALSGMESFRGLVEQVDPQLVKTCHDDATLEETSFYCASQMVLQNEQKQKLLEMTSLKERFAEIIAMLRIETETLRFLLDENIERDPRVCLN